MLYNPTRKTVNRSDGTSDPYWVAEVILGDMHGEYIPGAWEDKSSHYQNLTDFAMTRILLDVMAYEEAYETLTRRKEVPEEVYATMLPGIHAALDGDEVGNYAYLWFIAGTDGGMDRLFRQLSKALDVVPSGDDDFFDYWPNSMDTLWQFAKDLDGWETIRRDFDDYVKIVSRQLKVKELAHKVYIDASPDNRHEWIGRGWLPTAPEVGG